MTLNKLLIHINKEDYSKTFRIKYSELNISSRKKVYYNIYDTDYINIEYIYFDENSPLMKMCDLFLINMNGILRFSKVHTPSIKLKNIAEEKLEHILKQHLTHFINNVNIYELNEDSQITMFFSFNMVENLGFLEKIARKNFNRKLLNFFTFYFTRKKNVLYENLIFDINILFKYLRSDRIKFRLGIFLLKYLKAEEINIFYKIILFDESEIRNYFLFKVYEEFQTRGFYRYAIFILYILLLNGNKKYNRYLYRLIVQLNDSLTYNLFVNSQFYKLIYENEKNLDYLLYLKKYEVPSISLISLYSIYKRNNGLVDYTTRIPFVINNHIKLKTNRKFFCKSIMVNGKEISINKEVKSEIIVKIKSQQRTLLFQSITYGNGDKKLKYNLIIECENLKIKKSILQNKKVKVTEFEPGYFLYK